MLLPSYSKEFIEMDKAGIRPRLHILNEPLRVDSTDHLTWTDLLIHATAGGRIDARMTGSTLHDLCLKASMYSDMKEHRHAA